MRDTDTCAAGRQLQSWPETTRSRFTYFLYPVAAQPQEGSDGLKCNSLLAIVVWIEDVGVHLRCADGLRHVVCVSTAHTHTHAALPLPPGRSHTASIINHMFSDRKSGTELLFREGEDASAAWTLDQDVEKRAVALRPCLSQWCLSPARRGHSH